MSAALVYQLLRQILQMLTDLDARVERRPILGGLINEYAQAA